MGKGGERNWLDRVRRLGQSTQNHHRSLQQSQLRFHMMQQFLQPCRLIPSITRFVCVHIAPPHHEVAALMLPLPHKSTRSHC